MTQTDAEIYRNNFARRCFLEPADGDYIAARTLFRNQCYDQFLLPAQQCIEKYFKAILLFNTISCREPTHDLEQLLSKCELIDFIAFSEKTKEFIKQINGLECTRYLTYSFSARREYLLDLDNAVFEIRKFCRSDSQFARALARTDTTQLKKMTLRGLMISSGLLERVLQNRNRKFTNLRENLIWKNFYFGKRRKKRISFESGFWAKNAPLGIAQDRECYEAVKDYVYLPREVHNFFRRSS